MKHIILDVDELEKLPKYKCGWLSPTGGVMPPVVVSLSDLRALIASSPQADEKKKL